MCDSGRRNRVRRSVRLCRPRPGTRRLPDCGAGGQGGDMFGWVMPEGLLRDAPAYAPRQRELADLELLLSGALRPATGFHTRADLDAIRTSARLADGTPWPVRLTLEVPTNLVAALDTTN